MISIVILTFNDEVQITNCLDSIADLTDDIVVVDSFSTDRTLEICRSYSARVYQHEFVNQAHQFNWALDNIPLKYDWVLRLDSDEVVPEPLREEIRRRVGSELEIVAYAMNRRVYWMGRWLRHGRMYPHYIVRLFRKGRARYEPRTEAQPGLYGAVSKVGAVRKNRPLPYLFRFIGHRMWHLHVALSGLVVAREAGLGTGVASPVPRWAEPQVRRQGGSRFRSPDV